MEASRYVKAFNWAFMVGKLIMDSQGRDEGEKLLKRLLYDLRGEDLPGRFRDVLMQDIYYLQTAREVESLKSISVPRFILEEGLYGDRFYYLKSAIIAGFMNALASSYGGGEEGGE